MNNNAVFDKLNMKDKKMTILDQGARRDMLQKERKIVEKTPGSLNREKWAGKAQE